MDEIISRVYDYNSVIVDLNNFEDEDSFNIPTTLINKKNKIELEIFKCILEYAIQNNHIEKPPKLLVDNIHANYFKVEQLIPIVGFRTYLTFLIHSRQC
jgi:hypothetical protein